VKYRSSSAIKIISKARDAPIWLMVNKPLQIKVELISRKKGLPFEVCRCPIKARMKIARNRIVLVRKLIKPIDRFTGKTIYV
jgi:hypothetical protein